MSHAKRKLLLDCNGELQEAATMVPLAGANGLLTEQSMEEFIADRLHYVKKYRKWKEKYDLVGAIVPHNADEPRE